MRIGLGTQGTAGSGVNGVISWLTNESWLATLPNGRPAERVATGWTWDASATTLRLTLPHHLVFHDGTLLTPEIAAESLKNSIRAKQAVSFSDVTSVTAAPPDAVDIHLSQPNAFLLSDLALVSVEKPGTPMSGVGPFTLVRRDDRQLVLEAFSQYYRGTPGLSEINVSTYPTQRSAWAALMRGDIDMLYEVSRDAAEFVEAESTVRSYRFARPYYVALVFNVRNPILRRAEVRRAVNAALDRTALVRDGLNGWGRPADGPIPTDHWAYSPGTPFSFDPQAAAQTLDKAGYPIRTVPRGTVPRRFSFTCLSYAGDSRFDRLAILVQKELAEVGIDMKLQPLQQAQLESRLKSGDFDAFLFEMNGRSLSWMYQFWRSQQGGPLNTGYRAADDALDRLKRARSDDEVREGVADLVRVMHDDPPAAFLAWQNSSRAVSTRFDVGAEKDRDIIFNLWHWHLTAPTEQTTR